ncbi:MAG TPA: hypothetical protein VKR32_16205 [Puia sp.]|nr:hypothetical protein [Puia sp.]
MKPKTIILSFSVAFIFGCHGTASKDYDKKEKNDPANIAVPNNSDATNPSLADSARIEKDSAKKK